MSSKKKSSKFNNKPSKKVEKPKIKITKNVKKTATKNKPTLEDEDNNYTAVYDDGYLSDY